MCTTKDVAKVLVGVSLTEIFGHTVLAQSALLPLTFFGITVTPTYNLIILLCWIVVGAFSIHYAWFKKQSTIFDRLLHIIKK